MNNKIKLKNISLIESSFKREFKIDFENPEAESFIDIEVKHNKKENMLFVELTLIYTLSIKPNNLIASKIKMLGIFEMDKDAAIPEEKFASINAPAIIFPYIREHLSSLSIKASLQPILLQPVNFVELAKKDK